MDKELEEYEKEILASLAKDSKARRAVYKIVLFSCLGVIGFCLLMWMFVSVARHDERIRIDNQRKTEKRDNERIEIFFSAWTKETGNPKKLTQEEFKLLKMERSSWSEKYYMKGAE